MRAKPWIVTGVVVVGLVGCGVGAYVIANNLARDSIQSTAGSTLESEISKRLGADADVEVKIGSDSVLGDLGSGTVKDVDASVKLGYDTVLTKLHDEGLTMVERVSGQGDTMTLDGTYDLAGVPVPVSADVKLVPDGGAVKAEVLSVRAAGKQIDVGDLPKSLRTQLDSATLPIPDLPQGIDVSKITGGASGVTVDLHADEINLDTLRKGL